jgi:hypothetical protein
MTIALERDKPTRFPIPENSLVLRNDILLPKSPDSCIFVKERGLRICPEVPLFTGTDLAKRLTPQSDRSDRPIVKSNII